MSLLHRDTGYNFIKPWECVLIKGKIICVFHCWIPSENQAFPEDGLTFFVNTISLEFLPQGSKDAFTKAGARLNDYISRANICMIKFYGLFFQERGSAKTICYYPRSKAQGDAASLIQLGSLCLYSSIHDLPFFYHSRKFRPNITMLLILFSVGFFNVLFYTTYPSLLSDSSKFPSSYHKTLL